MRSLEDLEVIRTWCRAIKLKNGRIKNILKRARRAVLNPSMPDFIWLYP